MATKFSVIFDNGGGTTLQTAKFCHNYDTGAQAAVDVKVLLDGGNTSDWDGNEPSCRMAYDYNEARNGGYSWHYDSDVKRIVKAGKLTQRDSFGRNCESFYQALGVTVPED